MRISKNISYIKLCSNKLQNIYIMNKINLIASVMLFLVIISNAQEVKYKISEDTPEKINNFSCNIDLLHMDGGFNNLDGLSFNVGLWGHAMYKQKFGADYSIRYGLITFGNAFGNEDLANNTIIQLGGNILLNQKNILADNVIYLKSESAGYNYRGNEITRVTYIKVKSGRWKYQAARAGLYFKRNMYVIENPDGEDYKGNYYTLGLYGGICLGNAAKVLIQTDNFGEKGRAFHNRFFFDLLLTPVHNVPENAKARVPVGARFVWQNLPVVSGKKNRKKYKQGITAEIEAGYRMLDGLYVAGTLSFSISKTLKFLSADGTDESKQRTTE
jgi:hypothetical protein